MNAEQLIESCTLVAISEPSLDGAVDRERNCHGHKKYEHVLLEKAAKTLPDHYVLVHIRRLVVGTAYHERKPVGAVARGLRLFRCLTRLV